MSTKNLAVQLFKEVLGNVDPQKFLPEIVQYDSEKSDLVIQNVSYTLRSDKPLYLIGTGKASPTMAMAMEKILGNRLHAGMIIAPQDSKADLKTVEMLIGSHPLPDEKSFTSSKKLLDFIHSIPADALVLNLVSGGTSSLFSLPKDEISHTDLKTVYQILLNSGASIQEINSVRKTLSKVKGGQLLNYLRHTTLIDIIISDVPDDDLRFIGSGPTISQEISFEAALEIIHKYNLTMQIPDTVMSYLNTRANDSESFNVADFDTHQSFIVSSASIVAEKFSALVQSQGYQSELIKPAWSGLIDDFEKHILSIINPSLKEEETQKAFVFFGECTVEVSGDGLGGRNQELALRMAKQLKNYRQNVTFMSAGTDGIDGPTDAAGAVVDQKSYAEAASMGIDPDLYLTENNSYRFFEEFGGHIITGPTGNNVMDLQLILID